MISLEMCRFCLLSFLLTTLFLVHKPLLRVKITKEEKKVEGKGRGSDACVTRVTGLLVTWPACERAAALSHWLYPYLTVSLSHCIIISLNVSLSQLVYTRAELRDVYSPRFPVRRYDNAALHQQERVNNASLITHILFISCKHVKKAYHPNTESAM